LNILQSIIYGLISGLSEFLPISLLGHQSLLKLLFGTSTEPFRDLLIHFSILVAVLITNGTYINRLKRELKNNPKSRKRSRHEPDRYSYEFRLMKSSLLPMILGVVLLKIWNISIVNFAVLAVFFIINGLLIYLAEHVPHGNKDGSKLSAFDGLLIGFSTSLSVLPGISRVGASMSCLLMRGADRNKSFNWILVLTIPAMVLFIILDLISMITVGFGSIGFVAILGYLLSACFSFAAALGGIYLMRFLSVHAGYSVFAFYSWGTALLSFILYLNV